MLRAHGRPRPGDPEVTAGGGHVVIRWEAASRLDDEYWFELTLTAADLRGLLAGLPDAPAGAPAGGSANSIRVRAVADLLGGWSRMLSPHSPYSPSHVASDMHDARPKLADLADDIDSEVAGLRTTIARLRAFLHATDSEG